MSLVRRARFKAAMRAQQMVTSKKCGLRNSRDRSTLVDWSIVLSRKSTHCESKHHRIFLTTRCPVTEFSLVMGSNASKRRCDIFTVWQDQKFVEDRIPWMMITHNSVYIGREDNRRPVIDVYCNEFATIPRIKEKPIWDFGQRLNRVAVMVGIRLVASF